MRRLLPLAALLLAAGALAAESWQPYRLRGSPFALTIPPGAVARRRGPPRVVEDGGYTLRETYGEEKDHGGIVIPLRHGFLSAVYYRSPSVYDSIPHYLAKHRKDEPWGKPDRGTWNGLPALTAGWAAKALDGTPTVTVDFLVEAAKGRLLVLELYAEKGHLDEETPYFVTLKESLKLGE